MNFQMDRSNTTLVVLERPDAQKEALPALRCCEALGIPRVLVVAQDHEREWIVAHGCHRACLFFPTTSACHRWLAHRGYTSVAARQGREPARGGLDHFFLDDEPEFTQRRLALWFAGQGSNPSHAALQGCAFCVEVLRPEAPSKEEELALPINLGIVVNKALEERRKWVVRRANERWGRGQGQAQGQGQES